MYKDGRRLPKVVKTVVKLIWTMKKIGLHVPL